MGGYCFKVKARTWLDRLLDYIYAPECPHCGEPDVYGPCPECAAGIRPQAAELGRELTVYSGGVYEGALRSCVLHFKKFEQTYLAQALGLFMLRAVPWFLIKQQGVICVPVPPAPQRLKKRGFHCPELLGRELCRQIESWTFCGGIIKQNRTLLEQKTLSRRERFLNVRGAFTAEKLNGENIVLTDDVVTSGATLHEASAELYRKGAGRVWAVCAAMSKYMQDSGLNVFRPDPIRLIMP